MRDVCTTLEQARRKQSTRIAKPERHARALIRRSDYYVFNRPLSALDRRAQDLIVANVLAYLRDGDLAPGIAWVLSNVATAVVFDRVAVFDKGSLSDQGTHIEVAERNGIFREMMSA